MEICINMDKRRDDNNNSSLWDHNRIDPIINVKSLMTIIKHPIMTLKIIGVAIATIILFLVTLLVIVIEDKETLKKLRGKKE